MHLGLIQNNPRLGDFTENKRMLLEHVQQLAKQGAHICVAPAFALCGMGGNDEYRSVPFLHECAESALVLAQELALHNLPPVILGAVMRGEASPVIAGKCASFHAALLLHEGAVTVLAAQNSAHYDCLQKGDASSVGIFTIPSLQQTLAVAFAHDVCPAFSSDFAVQAKNTFMQKVKSSEAQAIVLLHAEVYEWGRQEQTQKIVQQINAEVQCPVALVNLVGGTDGAVCAGGSFATTRQGSLATVLPRWQTGYACVDVTSLPQSVTTAKPQPIVPEAELWQALVFGLGDFVKKCGFSQVALGLSGGIDSALVAALAVEALGAENVHCLLMPSPYSSAGSIDHSLELAQNLGIQTHTVPISPMFAAYEQSLEQKFSGIFNGLIEENTQSRIRGALIMAFAGRFNALVLSTSNKSEMAVGYCTLYGDMSGALAVLGDVYKNDVYALCKWRNNISPVIPDIIITKEPSAELRENQKDTDSLPPYAILDAVLYALVEEGLAIQSVIDRGYDPAVVQQVQRLLARAEFKRRQAPPVLQVSSRPFGAGWHMAIAKK